MGEGTKVLPWWLELVSKLRGGVLEVEVWEVVVVWEEIRRGFLGADVEVEDPAKAAVAAAVAVPESWRSRRRAAGTHVLLMCVEHSKPRLLQHVLHRRWVQSFLAWLPQSWQVGEPPATERMAEELGLGFWLGGGWARQGAAARRGMMGCSPEQNMGS